MSKADRKKQNNTALLANMRKRLLEDCRHFGIDVSAIKGFINFENQHRGDGDCFEYEDKTGYSYSYWERGQCNFGFSSHNELDFRFLCLRHLVYHNFSKAFISKQEWENFLYEAWPVFHDSNEYGKALVDFRKQKGGLGTAEGRKVTIGETKAKEIIARFDGNEFLKKILSVSYRAAEIRIDKESVSITTDIRDTGSYPVDPLRYFFKFSEGYGCKEIDWDTARDMLYYLASCSFPDRFDLYCYCAIRDIIVGYAAYHSPVAVYRKSADSQVARRPKGQPKDEKKENHKEDKKEIKEDALPDQTGINAIKTMVDTLKNGIDSGNIAGSGITEQIIGIDTRLRGHDIEKNISKPDKEKEKTRIANEITEILKCLGTEEYVDVINTLSENLRQKAAADYKRSVIPEMIDDYEIRMQKELREQTEKLQKAAARKEWAARFLLDEFGWANDLIRKTEIWLRYVRPLMTVALLRGTENSFVNESVKCLEELLKNALYHSDAAVYKLTLVFSEFFAGIPSVMAWINYYKRMSKGHLKFLTRMSFEEYESKCEKVFGIFRNRQH